MARPKSNKERKPINCNIDAEVYDALNKYCNEVGQTRTTAVERIIKKYLEERREGVIA